MEIDANEVIQRLASKLTEAQVQITVLETQIAKLQADTTGKESEDAVS